MTTLAMSSGSVAEEPLDPQHCRVVERVALGRAGQGEHRDLAHAPRPEVVGKVDVEDLRLGRFWHDRLLLTNRFPDCLPRASSRSSQGSCLVPRAQGASMTTVRHPADEACWSPAATRDTQEHREVSRRFCSSLRNTSRWSIRPSHVEHAHRAQPALALAAVPHHLDASGLQRLEHGGVLVDHDLSAERRDGDAELLRSPGSRCCRRSRTAGWAAAAGAPTHSRRTASISRIGPHM